MKTPLTITLFLLFHFLSCFSFENTKKVVLITGATQGLDLSIAKKLSAHNFIVYGTFRKNSNLIEINELSKKYENFFKPILLDVTDESSINTCVIK